MHLFIVFYIPPPPIHPLIPLKLVKSVEFELQQQTEKHLFIHNGAQTIRASYNSSGDSCSGKQQMCTQLEGKCTELSTNETDMVEGMKTATCSQSLCAVLCGGFPWITVGPTSVDLLLLFL